MLSKYVKKQLAILKKAKKKKSNLNKAQQKKFADKMASSFGMKGKVPKIDN